MIARFASDLAVPKMSHIDRSKLLAAILRRDLAAGRCAVPHVAIRVVPISRINRAYFSTRLTA